MAQLAEQPSKKRRLEASRDALTFPSSQSQQIDPYIEYPPASAKSSLPHITLTFATSLDSNLSLSPGVQTVLSGPQSKAMTHYLRSRHDAILVGVGTAMADNPSLNCRIEGVGGYGGEGLEGQPRPVILDPHGRWKFDLETKCIQLAKEGRGRGPILITITDPDIERRSILESVGGKILTLAPLPGSKPLRISWNDIHSSLAEEGIRNLMVEGGGSVINELLSPVYFSLVKSVIVTVAPIWLGKEGVQVCPDKRVEDGRRVPVARLNNVKWVPLGEDVVLCGRVPLRP